MKIGRDVIDVIADIDNLLRFSDAQSETFKSIHYELQAIKETLEEALRGIPGQPDCDRLYIGNNKIQSIIKNLDKIGCYASERETIFNVSELYKAILVGQYDVENKFGGLIRGPHVDDIRQPLMCNNFIPDLKAECENYLRLTSKKLNKGIVTYESTVDECGYILDNLSAYALVNKYLKDLRDCDDECIFTEAINKFRVKDFESKRISTHWDYIPNYMYTVEAKIMNDGDDDHRCAYFLTDGSLLDFEKQWNDSDVGELAPAIYVSNAPAPYVEITVLNGSDIVFAISPADKNQDVKVSIANVVEGKIQHCITLNTCGKTHIDCGQPRPRCNIDCNIAPCPRIGLDDYGRDQVLIAGYATIHSPDPFKIITDSEYVMECEGIIQSDKIKNCFPYNIDWPYKVKPGLSIKIPTKCGHLTASSDILVVPIGIIVGYFKKHNLADFRRPELCGILGLVDKTMGHMLSKRQANLDNEDVIERLKCEFIQFANKFISSDNNPYASRRPGNEFKECLDPRFGRRPAGRRPRCDKDCDKPCRKPRRKKHRRKRHGCRHNKCECGECEPKRCDRSTCKYSRSNSSSRSRSGKDKDGKNRPKIENIL